MGRWTHGKERDNMPLVSLRHHVMASSPLDNAILMPRKYYSLQVSAVLSTCNARKRPRARHPTARIQTTHRPGILRIVSHAMVSCLSRDDPRHQLPNRSRNEHTTTNTSKTSEPLPRDGSTWATGLSHGTVNPCIYTCRGSDPKDDAVDAPDCTRP